ncbi:MAG TPA: tetratricopeptide repeat protein, partial [Acidobacteriota bacterium]|nr:tetratricopeptide repeat protein [Acidobacteriota bacterium]
MPDAAAAENAPAEATGPKAQELGDLYFAAENFGAALECYRRALEGEAARPEGPNREAMLRLGTQIVECLRHRGDVDEAVDTLRDLHHRLRPHVQKEQIGRLALSLAVLHYERGRYRPAHRAAMLAYRL